MTGAAERFARGPRARRQLGHVAPAAGAAREGTAEGGVAETGDGPAHRVVLLPGGRRSGRRAVGVMLVPPSPTRFAPSSGVGRIRRPPRARCGIALEDDAPSRRAGADEPALVGGDHGLHAVARPELHEHAADVRLDGRQLSTSSAAISAFESPRATSVRTSTSRSVRSPSRASSAAPAREAAKRSTRRRVIDGARSASSSQHALDRGDQPVGGDVLEQEAARAGAQRLVDVVVEVERREHEDARAPAPPASSRVAAMPSSLGMRTSMSTTSGPAAAPRGPPPRRRRPRPRPRCPRGARGSCAGRRAPGPGRRR